MDTVLAPDPSLSLQRGLHRLWVDHVVWTRQYVVSAIAGAADGEVAAARLLKNQEDIGNAFVPYYGPEVAAAVTDLLKRHIMIAVDLVDAAIRNDQDRFNDADRRWDENSAQIAAALGGVNPYWPEQDVHDLLNLHLALTRREVVARLQEDWQGDVASFDDILTEILTLADALAEGIIKQFPQRFLAGSTSTNGGIPQSVESRSAERPTARWR